MADWEQKELDILEKIVSDKLDDMDKNPDKYDPDEIGQEIEDSKKMFQYIDILRDIDRMLDKVERGGQNFIFQQLSDLRHMYPLTSLSSYEEMPEEWDTILLDKPGGPTVYSNKRYRSLLRRIIRYETEPDKDVVLYSDCNRYEFYNLLINKKILIDTVIRQDLYTMLDSIIPIEFPYFPQEKVRVYIEHFECTLQEGADPVHSLAVTHYLKYASGKPNRIMKFFDITDGHLKEIEFKVYANRRQIYDRECEKADEALNSNISVQGE